MEEIETKLASNNPILISSVISKLMNNIRSKNKEDVSDITEFKYLKEKCTSIDPLTSDAASTAIVLLANDGLFNIDTMVAEVITAIPTARCYSNLASLITKLMSIQYSKNKSHGNYNLSEPQHPFIALLNENSRNHRYVYNEIKYFSENSSSSSSVAEIFFPVFLHSMCNPTSNSIPILKQRIWDHIIKWNTIFDKDFVFLLLSWMQIDSHVNIEMNSELIDEASLIWQTENHHDKEIILLWQCSLLYNLTIKRCDIRPTLHNISASIEKRLDQHFQFLDTIVLILAKTIKNCSPTYLLCLLRVCKKIITFKVNTNFPLQTVKMALLPWITNPSLLTSEAEEITNDLLEYIDTHEESCNENQFETAFEQYKSVICCNIEVYIATKFNNSLSRNSLTRLLEEIALAPLSLVKHLFPYLGGIFIDTKTPPKVGIKLFHLILKCLEFDKQLASDVLTIILYKLSNCCDSELVYDLSKTLPRMVVLKDNIPKVMATIQVISQNSSEMKNFGLTLMLDAWKIENKCFPWLESMVLNDVDYRKEDFETNVTRAFILKELCEHRPELHGKDLVAHLSMILNQCTNDMDLACALAIEGITVLCRAEVIDVVTTWATLAPKFKEDRRIPVIKSLCLLIHEIPLLPYTEAYTELINEVVETLWNYVTTSESEEVIKAALNALVAFRFEDICSKVPNEFLDQRTLDEKTKRAAESMPILGVPGATWVNFLTKCKSTDASSEFITKMVSQEISSYHKYIYHVKGSREPPEYNGLPTNSIVRELGSFIKRKHSKWKDDDCKKVYVEVLKILSQEFSKPLPPFDWCFLQQLVHESELKNYCISIACHQVILSGSARRLVENYMLAVAEVPTEIDIRNIYQNLKHIANSIQPVTLKPFLEVSFQYVICHDKVTSEKLLNEILGNLKVVLKGKNIQETNKVTIAQVLQDQMWNLPSSSKIFDNLLDCLILVPQENIDQISTINESLSREILEKASKIRFALAKRPDNMPLNWLNDIIEVRSKIDSNFFEFMELIKVFKSQINNTESPLWVLEIFGHIQAKVADRCDKCEITYYCDILMTSIVVFSGFLILVDENSDIEEEIKELFPVALSTLLKIEHWSICTIQVLEWLYHMNFEESMPKTYKNIFKNALCNLRDNDEFSKNLRWMKYLSCNIPR